MIKKLITILIITATMFTSAFAIKQTSLQRENPTTFFKSLYLQAIKEKKEIIMADQDTNEYMGILVLNQIKTTKLVDGTVVTNFTFTTDLEYEVDFVRMIYNDVEIEVICVEKRK